MLAQHVVQLGAGVGPQCLAVAEQKVEGAVLGDALRQFTQGVGEFSLGGHAGVRLVHLLQHPAKGQLAVRRSDRPKAAVQQGRKVFQVAVVGKNPVAAPEFAHKGVAVLQVDRTHRGLAHMGHDVVAFDGVAAQHVRNGRGGGAFLVHKMPRRFAGLVAIALKKSNTPAVGMVVGTAPALGKPGKTQGQAGGQAAVHS